jgi:hypothetical protein
MDTIATLHAIWQREYNYFDDLNDSMNAASLSQSKRSEVLSFSAAERNVSLPIHWRDLILKPLAEQIVATGAYDRYITDGPFLISSRVFLHFYRGKSDNALLSVSFNPENLSPTSAADPILSIISLDDDSYDNHGELDATPIRNDIDMHSLLALMLLNNSAST